MCRPVFCLACLPSLPPMPCHSLGRHAVTVPVTPSRRGRTGAGEAQAHCLPKRYSTPVAPVLGRSPVGAPCRRRRRKAWGAVDLHRHGGEHRLVRLGGPGSVPVREPSPMVPWRRQTLDRGRPETTTHQPRAPGRATRAGPLIPPAHNPCSHHGLNLSEQVHTPQNYRSSLLSASR